mmetsp:Transcript_17771/g.36452  ORF Transcript_17771/g.36452 Transcript_17771/m.36452 type:complete len:210 (+) Transcript_17771:547-1176(+)
MTTASLRIGKLITSWATQRTIFRSGEHMSSMSRRVGNRTTASGMVKMRSARTWRVCRTTSRTRAEASRRQTTSRRATTSSGRGTGRRTETDLGTSRTGERTRSCPGTSAGWWMATSTATAVWSTCIAGSTMTGARTILLRGSTRTSFSGGQANLRRTWGGLSRCTTTEWTAPSTTCDGVTRCARPPLSTSPIQDWRGRQGRGRFHARRS